MWCVCKGVYIWQVMTSDYFFIVPALVLLHGHEVVYDAGRRVLDGQK